MIERNKNGQFMNGIHSHPETEFKKGDKHWRDEKLFWDYNWLNLEYTDKKQTSQDIAIKFGVSCHAIIYWLKKHGIPRRSVSENHILKPRGCPGKLNPMYGIRGEDHPGWKGGCTPERQEFYNSEEWLLVVPVIWKRDNYQCQRCNTTHTFKIPCHIHHIISFSVRELRCVFSNLVLLCKNCHNFVHSKKNAEGEFIGHL